MSANTTSGHSLLYNQSLSFNHNNIARPKVLVPSQNHVDPRQFNHTDYLPLYVFPSSHDGNASHQPACPTYSLTNPHTGTGTYEQPGDLPQRLHQPHLLNRDGNEPSLPTFFPATGWEAFDPPHIPQFLSYVDPRLVSAPNFSADTHPPVTKAFNAYPPVPTLQHDEPPLPSAGLADHRIIENELIWSRIKGSQKDADEDSLFSWDAEGETDDGYSLGEEGRKEDLAASAHFRALPPSTPSQPHVLLSARESGSTLVVKIFDPLGGTFEEDVSVELGGDPWTSHSMTSPAGSPPLTPRMRSASSADSRSPTNRSRHDLSPFTTSTPAHHPMPVHPVASDSPHVDGSGPCKAGPLRFSSINVECQTEYEGESELFSEDEYNHLHEPDVIVPSQDDGFEDDEIVVDVDHKVLSGQCQKEQVKGYSARTQVGHSMDAQSSDSTSPLRCHLLSGLPRRGLRLSHLEKVFHMIHSGEYTQWIDWSGSGDALLIPDESAFAKNVMPFYFGTNQWDSFKRQLTTYKFSRRTITDQMKPNLRSHIIQHPDLKREDKTIWKLVAQLPDPSLGLDEKTQRGFPALRRLKHDQNAPKVEDGDDADDEDIPLAMKLGSHRKNQVRKFSSSFLPQLSDHANVPSEPDQSAKDEPSLFYQGLGTRSWKKNRREAVAKVEFSNLQSASHKSFRRNPKQRSGKGKVATLRPIDQ